MTDEEMVMDRLTWEDDDEVFALSVGHVFTREALKYKEMDFDSKFGEGRFSKATNSLIAKGDGLVLKSFMTTNGTWFHPDA